MGRTKIEWADRTWSPVTGCTKISPGCANCYAERMSKRFGEKWGLPADDPFKVTLHPERLEEPLRWTKPSKIFVCSMSDLFHDDVPFAFQASIFDVIRKCPQHTFLVLTKRPQNMRLFIDQMDGPYFDGSHKLPDNVWLGVTAENQEQADKRIPIMLQIPAAKRFVSVEPMLSEVKILDYLGEEVKWNCHGDEISRRPGLDWVICGGESGPGARPMHPDWVLSLRDQCQAANVPFLFKQWGEWLPISQMPDKEDFLYYPPPEDDPDANQKCRYKNGALQLSGELFPVHELGSWGHGAMQTFKVGKKKAGRLLDGQLWDQYPGVD